MNGCILLLAAALSLSNTGPADRKPFTLTPDGAWQPLQKPPEPTPLPGADAADDPRLAAITEMIQAGRFSDARRAGIDWLKENPESPQYDRALFLTAEALRGNREYIRAFYYCDQLLDEHGDSPLYPDALQLQYAIADSYLLGVKDRLLGLRIIGREEEAIDMLFRIQQRAPGSPVAEKALLRTADYYWANGDFDLASDAYRSYVQTYPRSPLVPQARLREAYANLAEFRGPAFDATPLLNARLLLNQMAVDYPQMARDEDLQAKIDLADRQLAWKLYVNADFYRRTGKPKAAVQLCRRLLKLYPTTPEASDAEKMLARLGANPPADALRDKQ